MPSALAHNNVPAHRFLTTFKSAFTTRSDGSTWPNWERTWIHADQYFRALLRPGRRKSITGLASRVGAQQERLERFVRESAWESSAVHDQLRATAPDSIQGPDAVIIHKRLHLLDELLFAPPLCYLDVSPAGQRLAHHEEVVCSTPFVGVNRATAPFPGWVFIKMCVRKFEPPYYYVLETPIGI